MASRLLPSHLAHSSGASPHPQIYETAAQVPVWRLRIPARYVHLTEGSFLQTTPEYPIGDAAIAFMKQRMPLLDVPWRVYNQLKVGVVCAQY